MEMVARVTGGSTTVVRCVGVGVGLGTVGVGLGTVGSATQACGLSPSCICAHRPLFVCCQPKGEEEKPQIRILPLTKKGLHHLLWRGVAKQLLFSSWQRLATTLQI